MAPPKAKKIPQDVSAHGIKRVDDYYWLRERGNPDVISHLEAENTYTELTMAPTSRLQEDLYDELVGRIKETDVSAPVGFGDYYYYVRTEEGKQYPIHCRRRRELDAKEEIFLDENELAEGHDYCSVGALKVSPNHKLLAFSVDTSGTESFTLYVKDLQTGELLEKGIPNTYYGVEWGNDNKTVYYNTLDESMRPYRLYRHRLGSQPDTDALLYQEDDDAYFLALSRTKSRRFLLMSLGSNTTSEVHYLEADDPDSLPRVIQPRKHEMEYHVTHNGDWFYILTNEGAMNFKVARAPLSSPGMKRWKDFVRARKNVKVDDIEAFANHLVLYERSHGLKRIRIMNLADGGSHYIEMPEPLYTVSPDENPEYNTEQFRFVYTSLVTPRTVVEYNMDTRQRAVKKQYEVQGGYDPENYHMERVQAATRDGTKVPISLVYRRSIKRDGSNPLFLYGYGAYGASVEPQFLSTRLTLLDRGFVCAIAHVRGGGEMGRQWYEEGKLLKKSNTFSDMISCAKFLVRKKYTSPGSIAIYGGSAGGLMVGAVMNEIPEMFRCAVANVPFVDVVTTMMDETIPLTVTEYEEWGNPAKKELFEYMMSYSPYDNVERRDYPHTLVTGGMNDPRVQYWEPAKWVAKLRELKTDENMLLLRTKMGEGHAGASGRYDYLRDIAFEYAFILRCFDISS
ncbi:MAG: S9 family peptidase [Candidatus Latescibacterota bacterium]|jgi:oligopeptidase B